MTRPPVLPSASSNASAPRTFLISRLDGWPVRTPADASPGPLRHADARLGADAGHYSFIVADFHRLLLAGLLAHRQFGQIASRPAPATTGRNFATLSRKQKYP